MPLIDEGRRRQLLWMGLIFLLFISAYVLYPFLLSLIMGAIFGLAFLPWHKVVSRKLRLSNTLASLFMVLAFIVFILTPISFVVSKGMSYLLENPEFVSNVNALESTVTDKGTRLAKAMHLPIDPEAIQAGVSSFIGTVRTDLSALARDTLTRVPDYVLQFLVMLMAMFVIMTKYKKILAALLRFAGVSRRCMLQMNEILGEVCHDVVIANMITGTVQAGLVAMGALFLSNADPILIFVCTFLLSFIPMIGAAPVAVLLSLIEFSQRDVRAAVILLVLAVVVGIADNILRAKLLAGRKQGSPLLNMLACFGGIYIWGLIGLFIAPMIVTFTVRVVPLLLVEIKKSSVRMRSGDGARANGRSHARRRFVPQS